MLSNGWIGCIVGKSAGDGDVAQVDHAWERLMDTDLRQAITLIKSGDKKGGGQLLAEIVKKDPRNVNAWLWLSSCVNSNEQRIYCLKKVLEIEPNHTVAQSALSKLQQPEPTEKEILGKPGESRQAVSDTQLKQSMTITPNAKAEKSAFQPKYLTAFAGVLTLMGTFFPWAALVYYGKDIIEKYSGLTQLPGMITAVIGLVIVFTSIFLQTKPGKPNSLVSSLLALVTFLMACVWPMAFYESCFEGLFGNACEYETKIGTGFGYVLSMFSLFLVFVLGLIHNPKE